MPALIKVQVYMKQAKLPPGWVTWYSYDDPSKLSIAETQQANLAGKGYDVRVIDCRQAVTTEPVCPLCESAHPEPFDGSCLL